jgi:hypothetical protein
VVSACSSFLLNPPQSAAVGCTDFLGLDADEFRFQLIYFRKMEAESRSAMQKSAYSWA